MMHLADSFAAWTVEHFGWLADFLLSLSPAAEGWIVLLGFLVLALGWNVLAAYVNRRTEVYDADWMELEAWEATR